MCHRIVARAFVAGLASLLAIAGLSPGTGPAPARAAAVTGFFADSEPGHPIGGGESIYMSMASESVRVVDGTKLVGIHATAFEGSGWWDLTFYAPSGQALVVGTTYLDVGEDPTATRGAMTVYRSATGSCTRDDARFTIRQVEAMSLAIDFRYRCSGSTATLHGSFRVESSIALRALTGPTDPIGFGVVAVAGGPKQTSVTLTARGSGSVTIAGLSIAGPAAAEYAIKAETCTAAPIPAGSTCSVTLSFDPALGGERPAALVVDDDTYRGSRSFALAGVGTVPTSKVTWSTSATAGPGYTWNSGASLARTVTGTGTGYLHLVATTDRVGSSWVDDDGPYAGILYARRTETGTTWSTATRLNPTNQHGYAPSVAASGPYVYATWVRPTKWVGWNGTAPRVAYFRRNASHGSGAWTAPVALTPATGRVDFPTLAASGSMVYVAYTDAATGSVKLKISADRGSNWRTVTIGPTTFKTADGYEGDPSVAAAGDLVVVSWTTGTANTVKARISLDRGITWKTATTLATSSNAYSTAAARGTRLAVGWATPSGAAVRVWSSDKWAPVRNIGPAYGSGATYTDHGTATVALAGTSGVGIAWSACSAGCSSYGDLTRRDLLWAESADNGTTWFRTQVVGPAGVSSARRVNDFPSVAWPTATTRHVVWNGWTPDSTSYRLYIRTGSGAP
jgi:hypothetical protein